MPAPYSPTAIANNFIQQFGAQQGIEHMKLQKLVYCAYGWWLAAQGMEAVRLTTEGPEIWKHGPVFESMYRTFRVFGRQPIREMKSANPLLPPMNVDIGDDEVRNVVIWIWGRYGHLSSFELSDLTHKQGTPWHRTAIDNGFQVQYNTAIPDQYIYEEFSRLLNADRVLNNGGRQAQDDDAQQANH